jgi:hypothetical protein
MKKPIKFHKIKGEHGGMSFSQFEGYSSDQSAKNARDKMVKQLKLENKTCKTSTSSAYAGGTMVNTYNITDVKRKL